MSLEDVQKQLLYIKDSIAAANVTLKKGTRVDLTALYDSVKTVRYQLNEIPRRDVKDEIVKLMHSIIIDLDTLSNSLSQQHQSLNPNKDVTENINTNITSSEND